MIYFPKTYGTCTGTNKVVDMALNLQKEFKDKKVYVYKEASKNKLIEKDLINKGITIINNLDELSENDILILRAHGENKEVYEELNKRKIKYYDATCINITKIHELVEKNYKNDKDIIIIGQKQNEEVSSINSFCNNTAIVIENTEDLKNIINTKDYYIVCQTTISYDFISEVLNYLNTNKIKYSFDNTICPYQNLIQNSSIDLAKNMDIMFIITKDEDSKINKLYKESKKICETYLFTNIKEFYNFIKKQNYTKSTKIGLTTSSNTPVTDLYEYMYLLEFFIYYKDKVTTLEKEILKFNKLIIKEDNKIIEDAINKLANINKGGKYLRGCLIDLGYKLNKKDDNALSLAVAYETFQTSILIHDDIIDNANLRRGKETIHYTYQNEFKNITNIKDNTPTSLALCLGDLGFYYTNDLIIKKYKNDKNFSKIFNYYNNIVINTIKGEILDVALPFKERYDKNNILKEDDIMYIYKMKTSWYTVVGPFCLGMILGNSKQKEIAEFENILEPLGIAFQIKDDILGIFSSNDILGKSVYSDIEEFKQTILYSYVKLNNKKEYNELLKYYGNKINKQDALKVQEIFIKTGALKYAEDLMNNMFEKSKKDIGRLNIDKEVKHILLGLITYLELREK